MVKKKKTKYVIELQPFIVNKPVCDENQKTAYKLKLYTNSIFFLGPVNPQTGRLIHLVSDLDLLQ